MTRQEATRLALDLLGQSAMADQSPDVAQIMLDTFRSIPTDYVAAMDVLACAVGIAGPMLRRLADAEGAELSAVLTSMIAAVENPPQ